MKPILFNTNMVRAIQAERKTVTRRAVKLKYSNTHLEMITNKYGTRLIEKQNVERFQGVWDSTLKPANRAIYGWDANPWVWVIEFERCGGMS